MNPPTRLLLVEDDRALRGGLFDTFTGEGYDVTAVPDGEQARAVLFRGRFDAVILDLMLPKRSGLAVLRELRARGDPTPVLVLTARVGEDDRVAGLELGADDYVTKPFSLRELVARVRALLRRAGRGGPRDAGPSFTAGAAEVDLDAFEVRRAGAVHALSPKEAQMLRLLHENLGKAVSRERFLVEVWDGVVVGTRTIDTHVLNLRTKLEADPQRPRHLLTVHGVGCRLVLGRGA